MIRFELMLFLAPNQVPYQTRRHRDIVRWDFRLSPISPLFEAYGMSLTSSFTTNKFGSDAPTRTGKSTLTVLHDTISSQGNTN